MANQAKLVEAEITPDESFYKHGITGDDRSTMSRRQ
jgi:hypothetical protein